MTDYIIGVIGTWLVSDGWYSLVLYKDKGEPFWKCHSIRVIRLLIGIALMVIGGICVS
ncbi:MAG: hypothetical protein WC560_10120 [Syntrophales bacterium]